MLKAEGEEKGRQPAAGLGLAFAWTCFTSLAAIGADVNVGPGEHELMLSALLSLEESLSILTYPCLTFCQRHLMMEKLSPPQSVPVWEFFPGCLNLKCTFSPSFLFFHSRWLIIHSLIDTLLQRPRW